MESVGGNGAGWPQDAGIFNLDDGGSSSHGKQLDAGRDSAVAPYMDLMQKWDLPRQVWEEYFPYLEGVTQHYGPQPAVWYVLQIPMHDIDQVIIDGAKQYVIEHFNCDALIELMPDVLTIDGKVSWSHFVDDILSPGGLDREMLYAVMMSKLEIYMHPRRFWLMIWLRMGDRSTTQQFLQLLDDGKRDDQV